MNAAQFATNIGGSGFLFGVKESGEFADELVKIAEEIRRGELIPQSVTVTETTTTDDYCMREIKITTAPYLGKVAPPETKVLYGPNQWPVAIVEKAE